MDPIRHIVLMHLKSSNGGKELLRIYTALQILVDRLEGASNFNAGNNASPEKLDKGFQAGFTIDFESPQARDAYLAHDDHVAIGKELVALCEGGTKGVLVFDMEL